VEPRFVPGGSNQYPVELEMKYKIRARTPGVGTGQTRWMSSQEVIFTADRPIEAGTLVEISIAWPVLLNNRVALQLVVEAKIAESQGTRATARILKHHFRTRGLWHREQSAHHAAYAGLVREEALCAS